MNDALKLAAKLRERYGATVPTSQAAALLEQQHAALESLRVKNAELERLCDETYVAQGSDAYHHACSEMERWQPIETAPKDGTNVLLINRALNQAAGLWMNSISGVGWYLRSGIRPDVFFNSHYGPTHWMPLPAAPTPPHADQKGQ